MLVCVRVPARVIRVPWSIHSTTCLTRPTRPTPSTRWQSACRTCSKAAASKVSSVALIVPVMTFLSLLSFVSVNEWARVCMLLAPIGVQGSTFWPLEEQSDPKPTIFIGVG